MHCYTKNNKQNKTKQNISRKMHLSTQWLSGLGEKSKEQQAVHGVFGGDLPQEISLGLTGVVVYLCITSKLVTVQRKS